MKPAEGACKLLEGSLLVDAELRGPITQYLDERPNTGGPVVEYVAPLEQLKCAATNAEDPLIASSRLLVSGRRAKVVHEKCHTGGAEGLCCPREGKKTATLTRS